LNRFQNITVTATGISLDKLSVGINIDNIINPRDRNTIIPVEEISEIDTFQTGPFEVYSAQIIEDSGFNISLLRLPRPQDQRLCSISQSTGVVAQEDINIQVDCQKAGSLGGSVTGLLGRDLIIQNGGSIFSLTQDGQFTFSDLFPIGSDYEISVVTSPNTPNQLCNIANGTGILPDSNTPSISRITNVRINCYDKPELNVTSLNGEVLLDWPDITADSYNVYFSTESGFNPENIVNDSNISFLENVTSPLTVPNLENKSGYYFVIEAVHSINLPFSEQAGARPDSIVVDGVVNSIITNDVGDIYMGGRFDNARAASGQGIPLSIFNRSLSIADYPLVNGVVTTSVSDGAGGWYIGGNFTGVGDLQRRKLAHILSDGSVDTQWRPDVTGVSIEALFLLNNVVYIGGEFSTVDGNPHQNFVAVGADGFIRPWNLDTDGAVHAFTSSGSIVYMGGEFSNVGGIARSRVAAIDNLGTVTDFEVDIDGIILTMEIDDNTLYIAGRRLSSVAGVITRGAIALDLNGVPTGWNSGNSVTVIEDLIVYNDIVFFADRLFSGSIKAIHSDGRPISWDTQISNGFTSHLAIADGRLIAAGNLTIRGDTLRNNVAAYNLSISTLTLNPSGTSYELDLPLLRWNPIIDSDVASLSVSGESIYIGGEFNGIGGVARRNLLSINTVGRLLDWNPEPNDSVNSVIEDNGVIYIGGRFTQVGESARVGLAAIDSNGAVTTFNPVVTGFGVSVDALHNDSNTLFIGGRFNNINGQSRSNLASMLTDGTLLDWAPNVNGAVRAISQNNGNLYIGGSFTTVNELSRSCIASFDSLGDLTSWAPEITNTFNGFLSASVNTILPINNNIYFGGHFTSVNGNSRNHAAAVDENAVLTLWDPNINHSNQLLLVNSLAQYQNDVVIGGNFSGVGDDARNSLAAVSVNNLTNVWAPDINGFIKTLHVLDDQLFIGGSFIVSPDVQSTFANFNLNNILNN